ncbi:neutral/alkaline non-lysosomal ceramidase N-terminal domain-containing protein [Paenibacillus sp. MBLB4367]|uniref:neutral/alkaline non-lysosomal ceramidase N-terminal domain-containing protein n=1 Tax=Paenibacillus sp. MBLB4367 TaxID=3384767 RepID=UPI0039080D3D
MKIKLGTAKADITPPFPVPLAGYSNRRDVYDDVTRPLSVRVWLFDQPESDGGERRKALLVQADLIWWGSDHVHALKRNIQDKWNIDPEYVFFHASHTHGGPQTTDQFSPLLGLMVTEYIRFLEQMLDQAIAEAHENVEAVTMEKGTGICEGIGINRRKIMDGTAVFAPNQEGPNDNQVTVIRCLTADGRTKGLLFHFTCHPTTTSANLVNSEYCGVAMELLDQSMGDGVSCFLQGCCGDIRPSLIREGQFYGGNDEDIQRAGAILSEAVEGILNKSMKKLEAARIEGWVAQAELPFRDIPLDRYMGESAQGKEIVQVWKNMMDTEPSGKKDAVTLDVQLLKLAEGFALMGLSGEMVVDYGLWIKNRSAGHILPLGYSNGMVGYVPTAIQIEEGGYEGVSSGYVFGYPAPFASDVEARVKGAVGDLMNKMKQIE